MKDRVKKQMFRLYEPYKDKGISLSTKVISTEYSESRSEDICRELFGNNDFAMVCGNIIDNECEKYITESGTAIFCMLWYSSLKIQH